LKGLTRNYFIRIYFGNSGANSNYWDQNLGYDPNTVYENF